MNTKQVNDSEIQILYTCFAAGTMFCSILLEPKPFAATAATSAARSSDLKQQIAYKTLVPTEFCVCNSP